MNQILLKLFIAIICSTYDDLQEKAKIPANSDYLDLFVKMWSNVDVKATGYISVKELDSFIKSLGTSSLGYPKHLAKSHIGRQKFNGLLELPVYCYNECGYFYSFQDVLDSLVSHLVISHFVKRRLKQERETALMAGANIYEEPEEGEK